MAHLLGHRHREMAHLTRDAADGVRPGMVRISLAAYNTADDLDVLVEMLLRIARRDYRGTYQLAPEGGHYVPVGCLARA